MAGTIPQLVSEPRIAKSFSSGQRPPPQRFSRPLPQSREKAVADSGSDGDEEEEVGAVQSAPINLWRRWEWQEHASQAAPESPGSLKYGSIFQEVLESEVSTCCSPSLSRQVWATDSGTSSSSLETYGSIGWLDQADRAVDGNGRRVSAGRCRALPHCLLESGDTQEKATNGWVEQADLEPTPVDRFQSPRVPRRRGSPGIQDVEEADEAEADSIIARVSQKNLQDVDAELSTSSMLTSYRLSSLCSEALPSALASKRRSSSSSGVLKRRTSKHVQFLLESSLQRRAAIAGGVAAAELAERLSELPIVAKARAQAETPSPARMGLPLAQAGSQCVSITGLGSRTPAAWSFRNGPPPWMEKGGNNVRAKSTSAVASSH